jgi:hypothetical protein
MRREWRHDEWSGRQERATRQEREIAAHREASTSGREAWFLHLARLDSDLTPPSPAHKSQIMHKMATPTPQRFLLCRCHEQMSARVGPAIKAFAL